MNRCIDLKAYLNLQTVSGPADLLGNAAQRNDGACAKLIIRTFGVPVDWRLMFDVDTPSTEAQTSTATLVDMDSLGRMCTMLSLSALNWHPTLIRSNGY